MKTTLIMVVSNLCMVFTVYAMDGTADEGIASKIAGQYARLSEIVDAQSAQEPPVAKTMRLNQVCKELEDYIERDLLEYLCYGKDTIERKSAFLARNSALSQPQSPKAVEKLATGIVSVLRDCSGQCDKDYLQKVLTLSTNSVTTHLLYCVTTKMYLREKEKHLQRMLLEHGAAHSYTEYRLAWSVVGMKENGCHACAYTIKKKRTSFMERAITTGSSELVASLLHTTHDDLANRPYMGRVPAIPQRLMPLVPLTHACCTLKAADDNENENACTIIHTLLESGARVPHGGSIPCLPLLLMTIGKNENIFPRKTALIDKMLAHDSDDDQLTLAMLLAAPRARSKPWSSWRDVCIMLRAAQERKITDEKKETRKRLRYQ